MNEYTWMKSLTKAKSMYGATLRCIHMGFILFTFDNFNTVRQLHWIIAMHYSLECGKLKMRLCIGL